MDEAVTNAFEDFHREYKRQMSIFRPCRPGGEIVEANLVSNFISSWKNVNSPKFNAVEVPFAVSGFSSINLQDIYDYVGKHPWRNHLDGLILEGGTLYLIEAKRDANPSQLIKNISADLERIHSLELAASLNAMLFREAYNKKHEDRFCIKHVVGIILADTWRPSIKRAWKRGQFSNPKIQKNFECSMLKTMEREVVDLQVKPDKSNESYCLLLGVTRPISSSLEVINGII